MFAILDMRREETDSASEETYLIPAPTEVKWCEVHDIRPLYHLEHKTWHSITTCITFVSTTNISGWCPFKCVFSFHHGFKYLKNFHKHSALKSGLFT